MIAPPTMNTRDRDLPSLRLLALCGPKGSGKSVVADTLVAGGFYLHRFAGPLKQMLQNGFDLTDAQVNGDQKETPTDKLCGLTPRYAMQTLGSEWGRDLMHADLWVAAWKNEIRNWETRFRKTLLYLSGTLDIVTDDLRFPNEEKAVRELGGTIIRVERPGYDYTGEHDSESYEPKADQVLLNNGSLDDLRAHAAMLIGGER